MATVREPLPQADLAQHPLDPLTPEELRATVAIVRKEAKLDDRALFETVMLQEPEKSVVRGFTAGDPIAREAFVAVQDRNAGKVFEGTVSLNDGRLTAWTHLPGVQTRSIAEEMEEMERLVKAHPEYLEGLKNRGIEDVS